MAWVETVNLSPSPSSLSLLPALPMCACLSFAVSVSLESAVTGEDALAQRCAIHFFKHRRVTVAPRLALWRQKSKDSWKPKALPGSLLVPRISLGEICGRSETSLVILGWYTRQS